MPSPTSWSDLRQRRVAIWGLGREGRASLRRLRDLGVTPLLVGQDADEVDGLEVVAFDHGGRELLIGSDAIVKSPGISRYGAQFRAVAGTPVFGGLGLWLAEVDRSRVLCITGTKGKSTTTTVAGSLLNGLGEKHLLAGNLGVPPWDPEVGVDFAWWVVETSSYQALDVEIGPVVVAVTSLSEDHLSWHDNSVETYYRDKLSLCTRPGVSSVVADSSLRAHEQLLGPHVRWVDREASSWADNGRLLGAHNRRNAEIARQSLQELGVAGLDDEALLTRAFASYEPLPHRLTLVGTVGGVDFVDDSISTNVLSTTAAVTSFRGRRTALLVGGLERGIDYRPLADAISPDVRVFTMPANGAAIGEVLRGAGVEAVENCASLEDAVRAAAAWAAPSGVVLLSPAAASFDRFADYIARGNAFAAAATALR